MALSDFSRVNTVVLIRSPAMDETSSSKDSLSSLSSKSLAETTPETILFLSWGDAGARHIEKYTSMYTKLYPGAKIILVRGGAADFFYRTERTQRKLLEPTVKLLSESSEDALLVHVMSNAGSKQWTTIKKMYFEWTGRTLSSAVTIIDSAPGRLNFKQTWAAMSRSLPQSFLPKMALGFVFGVILCTIHLSSWLLPGPNVLEAVREQMNDSSAIVKCAPRCYIFSEEDDIIGHKDVEEHAKEAQQKGWAVDLVKFRGSTHVGHFRQDPTKYIDTIQKTWLRRSG